MNCCCDNETENCAPKFSKEIADAVFDIKVILGSFGILLSLFALGLIGLLKFYKKFVYRLVMYLMAINIMQALCMVIELIPVDVTENGCIMIRNGRGWSEVCKALGYLDAVTDWMIDFVIIWIILYMLKLSWQLHRLQSNQHTTSPPNPTLRKVSHIREIVGVILLVFSPFLFCWIPFVRNMYGISGLWCWIKTVSDEGCTNKNIQRFSLPLMMVMYYAPVIGMLIFVLISMVLIIILLQKSSKNLHGAVHQRYQSSMKHIGFVLIYPLIYWLFCVLLLINRVYSSIYTYRRHHPYNYPLWIIDAVADPGLILIPALAFLLHPRVRKKAIAAIACRSSLQSSVSAHTKYSVPPEDDDISEGFTIRPTTTASGRYGSTNGSILFLTVNEK